MKLQTAIALRDELINEFALRPTFANSPSMGPGFRARRSTPPPSIALGIAPADAKDDDYIIAIRDQQQDSEAQELIGMLVSRCRGEVDLRKMSILQLRNVNVEQVRPLEIGFSVSNANVPSGTIGLFVNRPNCKERYLLSNYHVLVDEYFSSTVITQPGSDEKTGGHDDVATLADFVPISVGGVNFVDAAIARIDKSVSNQRNILASGVPIQGVSNVQAGHIRVSKNGRTTGLTHGLTRGFGLNNLSVAWGSGVAFFNDVFEVYSPRSDFSAGGDSGSLIYNEYNEGVGLLFSGGIELSTGHDITYAIPLTSVLNALNVYF
ncbi:hypothetical protein V8017_09795 [Stenotrophomonas rhizophila]